MNISDIDLNLLVFLNALLDECNVTRAAERVGITQPAMSNALKRLRLLLKDPLLVRTQRGMEPTERALALKRPVQAALVQLQTALDPPSMFDPKRTRRQFTLMITDYAASVLLPALSARLARGAPNVVLNVVGSGADSFAAIERGAEDFVIDRFDSLPESFRSRLLWRDAYVCVLRRGHPALAEGLTLTSYLALDHILITRTGVGLGQTDAALAARNLQRRIAVFTRHYHLPPRLIAGSDLCAMLPEHLVRTYLHHLPIEWVEPPLPLPPIEIRMVWGPVIHYDRAHRWLRSVIADVVAEFNHD
jgi:DNA-binding transcriptional LysR family regulator